MNAFMWALLAACIWGIVPLLEKTGLNKVEPLTGLFYRCFGVLIGLFLLGFVILKPQQLKAVDGRSILFLVLGGFLASFVGQIAFYHALKQGDVTRIVPISGTYPLVTFILGVLFLGETITWIKCLGLVLVIAGIWALKIG